MVVKVASYNNPQICKICAHGNVKRISILYYVNSERNYRYVSGTVSKSLEFFMFERIFIFCCLKATLIYVYAALHYHLRICMANRLHYMPFKEWMFELVIKDTF
ncbi:unnamed protein product [Meganyctiphanes norvegica]|uniref:Uncharacterized protein n=1 Tax=Meganyctiphanes norvegica TaxID=48144 RepID=A0AAV2QT13_MEGNR